MDPKEYAFVRPNGTVSYEFVAVDQDLYTFMQAHGAVRALPAADYKPPDTYVGPTMELTMFHGRLSPDQEMEDWGFQGPTLTGIIWLHTTYGTDQRIGFGDPALAQKAHELTGWKWLDELVLQVEIKHDLMVAKGFYYGDWEIYPS